VSEPEPPGETPSTAVDEPSPRFRLVVALLIGVVSILGACVAYSASVSSSRSSNLDQQAQQEFLLHEQILTSARAAVGEELRRVGSFQEQILSERVLREQAKRFRVSQPDVAAILEQQAQGAAALARTTGYFFFATFPDVAKDGTVTYDIDQAIDNLLSRYVIYQQLHPQETAAAADAADSESRRTIGVGIVFIAALFFLTIAQIATRRFRYPAAALGVVALAAGAVLWGLVESSVL
jgi:hypothetical protein